tara:strand:- start:16244 stop:17773 length:1530 start_codon:yes stop_codon:yes gene_type:complete
MKYNLLCCYICLIVIVSILGCSKDDFSGDGNVNDDPVIENPEPIDYSEIPQSDIYEVSVIREGEKEKLLVFKSSCPEFQLGKQNMIAVDKFPLDIFTGRSISWTNFSFSGTIRVEVKVLDNMGVDNSVKIIPSRHGVIPNVSGNVISFTLSKPGQFSVEIGDNGYKNGLMIFADPAEIDIPDPINQGYKIFDHNSNVNINTIGGDFSGIYFEKGIHDIGVYNVPANIKNIYLEQGAWVYGSLVMDGDPNVKIFGRGVLSAAKLDYRESHSIEAINQSDNIKVEGIVIADKKEFAVRLIGKNNTVKWTKVIGGWVYNTDGIAVFEGSTVSNCFIWANDDSIKVYRDNITVSDCVVWQLNNGGVIQMGWTAPNSTNVTIQQIDILRTEYNKDRFNVGILNYVGNSYNEPGKTGYHKHWLIEDVFTETLTQIVFNITPDQYSTSTLEGLILRNWNVEMTSGFQNRIIGNNPDNYFKVLVFDNVIFNGTKLDLSNWENTTGMTLQGIETPIFQ